MMPVCTLCSGLQKPLKGPGQYGQTDSLSSIRWVDTTLQQLRASSGACRACALLLNGVLFYHGRFATVKENQIRVIAETFQSAHSKTSQDHLSVEVRWKQHEEQCDDADDHEHDEGYPDLKLELFTDER